MRLLVNDVQRGKIYINTFATNASFASNVNFKFRLGTYVIACQ